jgi:hypothetical protein
MLKVSVKVVLSGLFLIALSYGSGVGTHKSEYMKNGSFDSVLTDWRTDSTAITWDTTDFNLAPGSVKIKPITKQRDTVDGHARIYQNLYNAELPPSRTDTSELTFYIMTPAPGGWLKVGNCVVQTMYTVSGFKPTGWYQTYIIYATGFWTQYTISNIVIPDDTTNQMSFFVRLTDTLPLCLDDVSLHPVGNVTRIKNADFRLTNANAVLANSRTIIFMSPTNYLCRIFSMDGRMQKLYKGYGRSIDLSNAALKPGRLIIEGTSEAGPFTFPINSR